MKATQDLDHLAERWRVASDAVKPAYNHERVRRHLVEGRGRQQQVPRGHRWRALLLVAAIMVVVPAAIILVRNRKAPPAPLALRTAGIEIGAWLATGRMETRDIAFSDGSAITLPADTQARIAHVDDSGARVVLERGTISFSITPRPNGSWRVIAGPYDIAVKGTEFTVTWEPTPSPQRIDVSVKRGVVFMSGPLVEEGKLLEAGQHLSIEPSQDIGDSSEDDDGADSSEHRPARPSAVPSPNARRHRPTVTVTGSTWQDLEHSGRYSAAVQAAEREGIGHICASASADELMDLARAARLSKRQEVARTVLMAARKRFPGSPQAARAAYLLGTGSGAAEAAEWFSTYLREQPSGRLAPEALGRLIESYVQSGASEAARDAAQRYLARHPDGPHAELARQVLRK